MSDDLTILREENDRLRRQVERERRAREEAERLAEQGTRALYDRQSEISLLAELGFAANGNAPVERTLAQVLARLAEFGDWQLAHVYRASDPAGAHLVSTGLWYRAAADRFTAFEDATNARTFSPDEGLPGRVWRRGCAILVSELARDPNFPRAPAAAACGLVSAFAFPIRTQDGGVAVVEFFSIRSHQPGEPLERLLPQITAQLGRIFEREAAAQAQARAHEVLERTVRERTLELSLSLEELERRIADQRRLQRSLLVQDRALAASADAIVIIDAQRPGRPLVYCNPAFERLSGYAREEAIGQPAALMAGHDTDAAVITRIRDSLDRGEHQTVELLTYRKDGSTFWSEVTIAPVFDENQGLTHFIAIQKDISQRHHDDEKRRALLANTEQSNAELARVARLKDEFLASMSHELRTPLNVVLGQTGMLQERLFGPLTEKQAEMVASIEESGRHLLDLINDVLDVSKIEAGKVVLNEGPIELSGIVRSSLFFIRQAAQRKELKVVQRLDEHVPLIIADGRRLKQMLVNLLSNAVKFTPEGGSVGLDVEFDRGARRVRFIVWDTGIGIAAEDQMRLFQPFMQIDSRLSRRYEGTGLGLALVRGLARLHGGDATCESAPGTGSRFIISIPWREPAPEPSALAALPPLPVSPAPLAVAPSATGTLERIRVLLAEDNAVNQEMFMSYLEMHGCDVSLAHNGHEALARLEREEPEVILMDVQMPEMDGFEAIRRIRALPRFAATPIIAVTALAMRSDEERCLAAGATRYLSKPVNLVELKRAVHELAGRASS